MTTTEPPVLSTTAAMQADHVTKEFGPPVAVDDVTFDVPLNSIVSIIGPNGAGKTTLFNMFTGLYKPTSGGSVVGRTEHQAANGPIRSRRSASRGRSRTCACSAR